MDDYRCQGADVEPTGSPGLGGVAGRVFGKTDGRNQARAQATRSEPQSPPVHELMQRLDKLTEQLRLSLGGTISMLNDHADRVRGPEPMQDTAETTGSLAHGSRYGGAMGDLFGVLGNLEYTANMLLAEVGRAADRNCGLA